MSLCFCNTYTWCHRIVTKHMLPCRGMENNKSIALADSGWAHHRCLIYEVVKVLHRLRSSHVKVCSIAVCFFFAGGRKPKMHQPTSNGSFDLGIKKRQREGKGLAHF